MLALTASKRRLFSAIAGARRAVKLDNDGLPIEPTWSVRALLETSAAGNDTSLSDEQFNHLFRLAQLRPPAEKTARDALHRDLSELSQFIEHIQHTNLDHIQPLTHLWPDNSNVAWRNDEPNDGTETKTRGRALLQKANQTGGHFYIVRGE